jgi:hypothetical protein
MKMRIVEAGDHDASAKVEPPRVNIGHRRDFVRLSNRGDSFSADRNRLCVFARRIGGKHLAVQ